MTEPEKQKILEEAIKKMGEFMVKEKPYLFKLDDLVTKTQNGVLQISLKVYNGFVTDIIIGEKLKRIPFKKP